MKERFFILVLLICIAFISCKPKKNSNKTANFFPVISFLKGQVKDIDSSLYRIIKIETINNGKPDSEFIKRDDFKNYASEFLNLPDIGDSKWKDDYTESNAYDKDLKAYILNYSTHNKDNSVKSEDVLLDTEPDELGNSKVRIIIIDQWLGNDDSTVHKNMVWEVNKRFYIVKNIQRKNLPDEVLKTEVIWKN